MEALQKHLPIIIDWVKNQEKLILNNGVGLSEDQKIDAYLIGVKNIDKVRLLEVDQIPIFKEKNLEELNKIAKDYLKILFLFLFFAEKKTKPKKSAACRIFRTRHF